MVVKQLHLPERNWQKRAIARPSACSIFMLFYMGISGLAGPVLLWLVCALLRPVAVSAQLHSPISQASQPFPSPTQTVSTPAPAQSPAGASPRPTPAATPISVPPPPPASPRPASPPTPSASPRPAVSPAPRPAATPSVRPSPSPSPAPRSSAPVPIPVPAPANSRTRPTGPALSSDFDRYLLGPGDSVFVNVLRFNDLSFQGTLDVEGNLLVPLVGVLRLQGLTIAQAKQRLQIELNRFVVNPQVDIILLAQRPVRVTVLGDVFRPGYYGLEAPQLITALVAAGGTTQTADLRTVRIRRALPTGAIAERTVDLYSPLQRTSALPNLRLVDGDTVIVPTLAVGAAAYDRILVARSTLAQPQINIRVLNYAGVRRGGSTGGRQGIASVTLPNGSTFLDALTAIAPNPDSADLSDIALIRYDPEQGRAVKREYNGRRALMGDISQNPALQHNDVIVIGRNFVSRVTYALNTVTQPFRDVLGFVLFFDSLVDGGDNLFRPGDD